MVIKNEVIGDSEYYAFVDSIETLDDNRTIIQFDCVRSHQIDRLENRNLSFDESEKLEASLIVCDFSDNTYQEFKNSLDEPLNENDWMELKLTDLPNQYKVTVIQEYDEEEFPNSIERYIGKGCKKVGLNVKKKLKETFYIQDDHRLLNALKIKETEKREGRKLEKAFDVVVYNVGQGNMNAILDQKGKVIAYYDVGGGAYWNAHTYQSPNPRNLCFTNRPIVILSHWDFDHWWTFNKALRKRNNVPIPKTTWIVPDQELGPIQSNFYKLLKKNHQELIVWSSATQTYIENLVKPIGKIIKCKGNSKNDSGLALIVESPMFRILLPGDASYEHIPNIEFEEYTGLVATHHGGLNTANLKDYPKPSTKCGKVIYSFGHKNTYHHPTGVSVIDHCKAGWLNIKVTTVGSVSFMSIIKRKAPCRGKCDLDIDQIF